MNAIFIWDWKTEVLDCFCYGIIDSSAWPWGENSCGWTVQIKSHERCNDVEMLWSDLIESPELLPGKITTRPHSGTKTSGRQGQPLPWTYNMVYFGMEHQWPMTKCVSLSVWIECLIFWLSVDFNPREEFSFLLFCTQKRTNFVWYCLLWRVSERSELTGELRPRPVETHHCSLCNSSHGSRFDLWPWALWGRSAWLSRRSLNCDTQTVRFISYKLEQLFLLFTHSSTPVPCAYWNAN